MKRQSMSTEGVRCWLSYIVTIVGVLGVVALAGMIMWTANATERADTAQLLLSSILPLLGTWVGTVLAYYFAKENFESAARATEKLAGIEKLRSMPVSAAMIPIGKADKLQCKAGDDPKALSLKALIDEMTRTGRQRLPVLDSKGAAVYIIHMSSLAEFIAQQCIGGAKSDDLKALTLGQLKAQRPDLFELIRAWACVRREATLADAKQAMEAKANCSDVFVTETGQADEPVIGWVTNADIAPLLRA